MVISLQFNLCVCLFRSGGACTEHRDRLSGLVFPSERPQRQQHPALSVYIQTIQPQWSVSLSPSFILQPYCHPSLRRDLISILNIGTAHTHICFSLTMDFPLTCSACVLFPKSVPFTNLFTFSSRHLNVADFKMLLPPWAHLFTVILAKPDPSTHTHQ